MFVMLLNHTGKRLYWSTANSIGAVAFDGTNKKTVIESSHLGISGLAFLEGSLYYVDIYSR